MKDSLRPRGNSDDRLGGVLHFIHYYFRVILDDVGLKQNQPHARIRRKIDI